MLTIAAWISQPQASADITVSEISGASKRTFDSTGVTVIGGLSGKCGSSPTDICDTCTNPTLSSSTCTAGSAGCCGGTPCYTCNPRTIADSTVLTISFQSNSVSSGTVKLKNTSSSITSTTNSTGGGSFVFTSTWSDLCNLITGCSCSNISNGNCTDKFNSGSESVDLTLEVTGTGTDSTDSATIKFDLYYQDKAVNYASSTLESDSLQDFFVYPGDEKVYIEDSIIGNYTSLSGIQFYIGTGSFEHAFIKRPPSPTAAGDTIESAFQDVDNEGTISQIIDGLENGVAYHFRPASVDKAGNVYNFMDDAYLASKNCTVTASGGGSADCNYSGTPSKVVGLLTEDLNCFVATAAYGTPLDPHIGTFRSFRQKVLLPTQLGRALNQAYYKYGPKMARTLHEHPWLKPLARAILWPAWGLTFLSLQFHFNLWQSFLLLGASILASTLGLAFMIQWGKRQLLRKATK